MGKLGFQRDIKLGIPYGPLPFMDRPWLVITDFNEGLNLSEHEGFVQRSQDHIDGFRDALDVCGINDLGYSGRQCTFQK